ncbi:domino [Carabus blaptoides fortunei]
MSEHITGAEQGALPPADGQPRVPQATDRLPIQLTQVVGTNQYVLTTQAPNIPPLTQLTSSGSPTNNTITRIISISNIRNSNLSNQSIVNALTKPRTPNVRTQLFPTSGQSTEGASSSLAVPSASAGQITGVSSLTTPVSTLPSTPKASPGSSPARKRPRLDDLPAGCENLSGARARAMQHKWTRSKCIKESYYEHCAELFFLESGGNMLDYFAWRKRPRTTHYASYLRQQQLEPAVLESHDSAQPVLSESSHAQQRATTPTVAKETTPSVDSRLGQTGVSGLTPVRPQQTGVRHNIVLAPLRMPQTTVANSTALVTPSLAPHSAPAVLTAVTNTTISTPVPEPKATIAATPTTTVAAPSPSSVVTPRSAPITSAVSTVPSPRPGTTPTASQLALNKTKSIVSAFPGTGSAEQIVEKAKQEAYVMQRISELQREGLWTERRLPKVQEVQRCKSHWDYLLEEMVWLAADFAQERKWKKAAAKKCARMVQKYFQDKALAAQKAEKAQELQLKRIASFIAKEIKTFWSNVEKLVEFKQQTRLEEKRKQALDQHLSFIVDQTEKYSQLLAEGMNKTADSANQTGTNTSRLASPSRHSDDEFCPENQSSSDDEETIAQAEAADESDKQTEEIAALQRESEMALEDFLNELPKDYLENRDKIVFSDADNSERNSDCSDSEQKSVKDERKKKDVDFKIDSGASEDDEDTIMEQEAAEGSMDHKQELDDLQAENEMSIEELRKKYLSLPALDSEDSKMSVDSDSASSAAEEESSQEESEASDVEVKQESEDEEEDKLGLKMLVEDEDDSNESEKPKTEGDDDHLINDVAALAESIQPKGNTLSSTSVVTPVPFLLKHPLREYQHIGLDWLVTMYERKLNGILADEMGLGKTIQTIALLAHLACEKGDWGPHLIIVPTSVMLNWEMECKKWCPGFKILTYYGTQKERKLKRTGWTKPNAFHICITSYKLVIQDHQSFRRKKWKYLILDEAQNIKNFKSQRWQLLLNFQTEQRLLLTGTPLQNNLMELWSLMHFLMPNVFQSHREFKEWFSNPVTGMIEGNSEYNESIIKRLHKVLRPFLLRRLKSEVEKQMPKKFEHIIMCRLSKRQRFLYDDYMSRAKTRETLATGNLLSVINVLMQLRKVCNHPNLFEVRPTVSPFQCEGISYNIPSIVYTALDYELFKHINLDTLYLRIINLEFTLSAYSAYATCKHRAPKKLIECIDDVAEPGPRPPSGVVHVRVKLGEPKTTPTQQSPRAGQQIRPIVTTPPKGVATSPAVGVKIAQSSVQQGLKLRVAGPSGAPLQGYSVQIVSHAGGVKAIPVALSTTNAQSSTTPTLSLATVGGGVLKATGDQRVSVSTGFAQLVQTPLGKHILLTQCGTLPQASVNISGTTTVMTSSGKSLTVLSKPVTGVTSSVTSAGNKLAVVNATAAAVVSTSPQASTSAEAPSEAAVGSTDSMALTRPLTASVMQQFRASASSSQMQTRLSSHSDKSDRKSPDDPFKTNWNDKSSSSRQSKLVVVHRLNEWRCNASPMYGADLRDTISMKSRPKRDFGPWTGAYVMFEQLARGEKLWDHGGVLEEFVKTPQKLVQDLQDMFSRFVFCVPAVSAKPLTYRVLNPPQSKYWGERRDEYRLMRDLSPKAALLHPIASAMVTQFPDPRLIQYDCGKLQTLDLLLRRLKSGGHRALIFTQMTRMLDVLEAFLNFHGHIYLRLDGTTKVDQRQVLMERFNGNTKIFAFILSTRSGGVGVNLTGADTVIFYDSDWNPTMDAQAQDRCHRIGQTRDVHIYRLISEKTIEENILKKANQKRMLGDLAIEGGNFTTAYFKSSTIQDLFNVDTHEEDANQRMSEVLNKPRPLPAPDSASTASGGVANGDDRAAIGALENALAACEDDQDVQAAKTAKAEAVADLAEFDESIPLEDHEKEPEMSKAEQEVQNLIKQLTPIERYAMKFVEETEAAWSAEQLAAAEREIEEQKREWEANRLAALRQEEERRARQLDDDSDMLTFSRDDATNQIWVSDNAKEQMPMWCPPTPPSQDSDMYIDYSMGFLYEMSVMSESQLPPVYVRKEAKRNRHEAGLTVDNRRALKIARKDEVMYEPRSLFDRPSPEMLKMRRELKQQRYRGIIRPQVPKSALKVPTVAKPQPDPPCWHPWTIHEDMALLKVIQTFQGLPLNLMIVSPGHTPNWDFAADYVNCTSITYRSAKQCRHRYENVLISREEGKILYDTSTRKKKTKNIYTKYPQQFKSNRPMRTAQLYTQDNNSSFSQLMIQRFDSLKQISSKRSVTTKSASTNSHMKNPKHTAVLTEYGIDYEHPLTPVEVATRRAERIQREKQKLGSMTTDQQQQRQAKQPVTSTAVSQPTSIVPAVTTAQPTTNVTTTTIIVSQQSTSGTSGGTVVTAVATPGTPPSGTTTLRTQRLVSSPLQPGTVTNVTGLTQAHVTQRLIMTGTQPVATKAGTPSGTATVATSKSLTPAQLHYYRQQMLKQQQLRVAQALPTQTVKGVTIAGQVAVTQGQQRTQFVKQQTIAVAAGQAKQTIPRTVTDSEMAALIKRQQQLQQQQQKLAQAAAAVGVSQSGQATTVQTLTQAQQAQIIAGIQVQQAGTSGTAQVATLVKAVSASPGTSSVTIPGVTLGPQVKAALAAAQAGTATKTVTSLPSQVRQLQIHHHLLQQQKKLAGQKITQLAQVAGKAGVATQLIVQAPKTTTMTMQQLQHVMRQPQLAVSQGQVVLAKAGPAARVIPVNAGQGLKQTIQVVTATSAAQAALVRPQVSVSSSLAGALAGAIKVTPSGATTSAQQQAILSQVSAALQGQVRQSGSPVRIQTTSGTPLVAVTVQSSSQQQTTSSNEQEFYKKNQEREPKYSEPPAMCENPPGLRGRNWTDLTSAAFKCNAGMILPTSLSCDMHSSFYCAARIILPKNDTRVVSLGSKVTLSCAVFGVPVPDIEWRRGSNIIARHDGFGSTNTNMMHYLNYTFTVQEEDLGVYYCSAYNTLEILKSSTTLIMDVVTK